MPNNPLECYNSEVAHVTYTEWIDVFQTLSKLSSLGFEIHIFILEM